MSDSTPPTQGRPRRRASRQAGPVAGHDEVGRTQSDAPEVVTAVRDQAATGPAADASPTVAAAAKQTAGVKSTEGSSNGDAATVKSREVPVDAESAGSVGIDATGSEATAKLDAADVDTTADQDVKPSRTMSALEWVAAAVAVVCLLASVGAGGVFVYHQRHADALASQRAEYIQTAKQAILNLTNISDNTAQQDIDRVLSVASGDLKAEYSQQKDAYAQVVQQAKVKATGAVIEAALESQGADSAQVLVAARQTLTNAGDPQPQDRYYRFRVTVNRGDGGVTASKVEFVA